VQASHDLAGVSVGFDERNLVPCAGLLPAAVLAQRLNVAGVIDERLTLARHGANSGIKAMTVIGSMLAGGDNIDDTALLRSGALPQLLDLSRAPSTIGTWLRGDCCVSRSGAVALLARGVRWCSSGGVGPPYRA
jgi:hypothetical protein